MPFDYKSLVGRSGISPAKLEELEREIREEFPGDDMLFELHMLRALHQLIDDRERSREGRAAS